MCCEAAAELILAQTGAPAFDVTEADGVSETGTEAETELENVLFSMRDALFRLACEDAPFDDKADRLYRTAKAQQEQYDDLLFPFPEGEDEDTDETDGDTVSWSQAFWRESTLTSLLELLLGFEINKDDWRTLLTGAKARLPEILARRDAFLQAYQGKRHEYDNLLTYFLYRHFMKALGVRRRAGQGAAGAREHGGHSAARCVRVAHQRGTHALGADLHLQGVLARD